MSARKRKRKRVTRNTYPTEESTLHTLGYEIHRNAVKIDSKAVDRLKKLAITHSRPIFNHSETRKRNDNRRLQLHLNSHLKNIRWEVKALMNDLNKFLEKKYPKHQRNDWVVIYSKEGCGEQAAHTDYEPTEELARVSDELVPLAALVCLMPGTKLYVWPNSTKLTMLDPKLLDGVEPIQRETVKLNPGDVLVFRACLVHGGGDYDEKNVRLHCFLDSGKVKRPKNRTYIINQQSSEEMKRLIRFE